jgi:sugar phosphate isomerase/epimerase
VVRTVVVPGRRYEAFASREAFLEADRAGRQALEWAEPVAARYRVPLAIENHKDHRVSEKLAILEALSSEWVGVCLDTGNDIALLEDPLELVEAYAPWTLCVHLKDMAVWPHPDGFLLAEVPLGEGFLDLTTMVRVVRRARPEACFTLEMITRDPLRVPCLTEPYWAAFDAVPARALARTLALVRQHATPRPLPQVSSLPLADQVALEEENIRRCLAAAPRYEL